MNRLLRPEVYRWPRLGQQLRTTSNGVRVRSPEQHREQQDPTRRAENSSSSGVPKKKKCVILSDRPISAVSVEVRSCKRTVLLKRPAVSVHRPNRTSSNSRSREEPENGLRQRFLHYPPGRLVLHPPNDFVLHSDGERSLFTRNFMKIPYHTTFTSLRPWKRPKKSDPS